jgi:hypothetical protein
MHPEIRVTLSDAVEAGRNYIEACSSPVALEIDKEICQGIGGHIHVATITPTAGFEWLIPPKRERGCLPKSVILSGKEPLRRSR